MLKEIDEHLRFVQTGSGWAHPYQRQPAEDCLDRVAGMICRSVLRKKAQECFLFVIQLAVPDFVVAKKNLANILKCWEIVLCVIIDKEDAIKTIGRRQNSIGK